MSMIFGEQFLPGAQSTVLIAGETAPAPPASGGFQIATDIIQSAFRLADKIFTQRATEGFKSEIGADVTPLPASGRFPEQQTSLSTILLFGAGLILVVALVGGRLFK